jgi:hypothetical protein
MSNGKVEVINSEYLVREMEKMKLRIEELEKKLEYKLPAIDTETKEKVLTHLGMMDAILCDESPSIPELKAQLEKAKELLKRIP